MNEMWRMDSSADHLLDRRKLRMLTGVDLFTLPPSGPTI